MIDLDAYFRRIGHHGPRDPTIDTLHSICRAHVQTIPFENIDVLLGRPISLEPEAVMQKLVHDRRGGYCFEQNTLLLAVLEQLGFEVKPLSARVRYQRPRHFTPARTHLLARVEIDHESWLADVGVGAMSPTAALRLNTEAEQSTPHEPRRLIRERGLVFHQVKLAGEWHDVAELTLEEMPVIDRQVGNWFTSASPQSHFRNRLLVARARDEGRVTILNDELSLRGHGGIAEKIRIVSYEHLLELLRRHFGIELPEGTKVPFEWP